jgi:hypothetical protein
MRKREVYEEKGEQTDNVRVMFVTLRCVRVTAVTVVKQ